MSGRTTKAKPQRQARKLDPVVRRRLKNAMGKHGLKGSTGLGVAGFFHVTASYDSNDKVFVEHDHPQWGTVWKRMSARQAKREKRRIIPCCMCDAPAVSLDHHWPYDETYNRCAEHFGKPFVEKPNAEPHPIR